MEQGKVESRKRNEHETLEDDLWTEERIHASLNTAKFGKKLRVFDSVGSTSDLLFRFAQEGEEEGSLVIAEGQKRGRGRLGRKWLSPRGVGIWMSLLLRPHVPASAAPGLSLIASLAVAKAIRKTARVSAFVKWPNDVLISRKKVSGILTEMDAELDEVKFVVLGIGINVNQTRELFPPELRASSTSLYLELGEKADRYAVLSSVLLELESYYLAFCESGFPSLLEEWRGMTEMWGRRVSVHTKGKVIEGIARDVDDSGALIVRLDSGVHEHLFSGDVSFL